MVKPLFLLPVLFFGIITSVHAQYTTETTKLPDGGTKTTTTFNDFVAMDDGKNVGIFDCRETTRNADGSLREIGLTKASDLMGTIIVDSIFGPGEKINRVTKIEMGVKNDTIYAEETNYGSSGTVLLESQKREYKNGNVTVRTYRQGKGNTFGTRDKSNDPGPLPARQPESVGMLQNQIDTNINVRDWIVNSYKITGGLGYSYLQSGSGDDKISFPLGAHVSFEYMLTPKIGLVADGSYHTKKENDYRISRLFLMGGLEYIFYGMSEQKRNDFLLFVRLMAGLAKDRQKILLGPTFTDTYNGVAIAAGLGLAYPLGGSLYLQLIPDYILTRFNDESQGNIRISAGVKYVFRRSPRKDNY